MTNSDKERYIQIMTDMFLRHTSLIDDNSNASTIEGKVVYWKWLSTQQIADATEDEMHKIRLILWELVKDGIVTTQGHSKWRLWAVKDIPGFEQSLSKDYYYKVGQDKERIAVLSSFCKRVAQQEDCPQEFKEIVDKEFWNLV